MTELTAPTGAIEATRPGGPEDDRPPILIDHRVRLQILGAILLGIFLSALDQTVVGTALPRIVTDLRGNELYTWVFTIYLLTATVSGPVYGKLSDLFGRRPMLMIGITLFLLGSVLCGLSSEMWQLVLFRGIQGLGAGSIFPIALAVIGDLFTPVERGKYQGLFGAAFGLSSLIGPAIGGLITDTVGWHWVFFVNLPLGLVSLLIIWRTLPSLSRPDRARNVDYLGVAVFTLAIVPILVGLTNAQSGAWTDPTVGGFILAGLALAGVFLWVESRAAEPLVPLELFRNRTFTVSVASVFLAAFGFFATVVFLPRWFQVVAGTSATESGYQVLPLLLGLIFSATTAGQVVSRTGRYRWIAVGAMVVLAVGLLLLSNLRADTPRPLLWFWMLVAGVGIGPIFAIFPLIVQNAVPFERLGVATANLTFFQQVGGTVGLSIAGSIFGATLRREVPAQLGAANLPPQLTDAFASRGLDTEQVAAVGDLGERILADVPAQFRSAVEPHIPAIVDAIHEAVSIATASTFMVGVAAALAAGAMAFFLREMRLRGAADPDDAARAEDGEEIRREPLAVD